MNKKLFLSLLIISTSFILLIKSASINNISGNMISNAGFASSASLIVAYFIAAALILGIAIIHLLNAYSQGNKHSSNKKHQVLSSKTASISVSLHPHKIFNTNIKNFLRPEIIIVLSVAVVAFISIIVMLV